MGLNALINNSTGSSNSAFSSYVLRDNTTGFHNTGVGYGSLQTNTTGVKNTAVGLSSLLFSRTDNYNTAIGADAGPNINRNPSNFTAIGYNAGHIGSNSNTIEMGNNSVSWIGGQVGWSTYSDEKIKRSIKQQVPGIAFISKLRPVTYFLNIDQQNALANITDTLDWEGKYDIENILQTGFIAQEVEAAAIACNYNFSGVTVPKGNSSIYSLQYSAFVVPLVKAVQEQQAIIENQQQQILHLIEEIKAIRDLIGIPISTATK